MPNQSASVPPKQYKRILSIDGGGIRSIIAIEVLLRLEQKMAEFSNKSDMRLADHFDMVAGTSAGAIIATAVALRISINEARNFMLENLRKMFSPTSWIRRIRYKYDKRHLEYNLKAWLGENTTLDSDRLETILLLIMHNASTDSPWLVSNNPNAPFNSRELDDCNLDLKLWQLSRASAAAPGYFEPELVTLGKRHPYNFIYCDGGLTGFNNPAFKAFLYATTGSYGLGWPSGEDRLLLLSIGNGAARQVEPVVEHMQMKLWELAPEVVRALIYASGREQDLLCRTFGRCLLGEPIDLEVGDLKHVRTAVEPRLFTYFRISPMLTRSGLKDLGCGGIDPKDVSLLDSVQFANELSQIGAAIAKRSITPDLITRIVKKNEEREVMKVGSHLKY